MGETPAVDRVVYILRPESGLMVPGLPGSVISFDGKTEVYHYFNRLITPGQTLMQWQSGPYQANSCCQPELPPLPRKRKTYVRNEPDKMSSESSDQEVYVYISWRRESTEDYYLQADYLDRRGRVLNSQRAVELPAGASDFGQNACSEESSTPDSDTERKSLSVDRLSLSVSQEVNPRREVNRRQKVDHWQLRLIQSGPGELWFHHIMLVLPEDEEAWDKQVIYHRAEEREKTDDQKESGKDSTYTILIPELSSTTNRLPDPERMKDIPNLITLPLALAALVSVPEEFSPGADEMRKSVNGFLSANNISGDTAVKLRYSGPGSHTAATHLKGLLESEEWKNITLDDDRDRTEDAYDQ